MRAGRSGRRAGYLVITECGLAPGFGNGNSAGRRGLAVEPASDVRNSGRVRSGASLRRGRQPCRAGRRLHVPNGRRPRSQGRCRPARHGRLRKSNRWRHRGCRRPGQPALPTRRGTLRRPTCRRYVLGRVDRATDERSVVGHRQALPVGWVGVVPRRSPSLSNLPLGEEKATSSLERRPAGLAAVCVKAGVAYDPTRTRRSPPPKLLATAISPRSSPRGREHRRRFRTRRAHRTARRRSRRGRARAARACRRGSIARVHETQYLRRSCGRSLSTHFLQNWTNRALTRRTRAITNRFAVDH
jgi:hypothetical protein